MRKNIKNLVSSILYPASRNRFAFTFIELLITLAILAILFVPVMQLFSQSLYFSSYSKDVITAVNLAKWEMEKVKNLNLTKSQLEQMNDSIYPDFKDPPLEMNGLNWRIIKEVIEGTDPLEIRISVFREEDLKNSLVTLVTLIEDMTWVEVKAVE